MDTDSQIGGGRGGRSGGVPNYKNDILIKIVELYLPQGLEAWRAVALAYQRESMETVLRRGEDIRDNWNRKLCNRMQKPTGKPGVNTDRIFHCIEIERRIQDEAAAAILGAESAESAHSGDDGESALSDVAAEEDDVGNDGDEEDEEVVAVNAAGDDENETAVAMVRPPRPQSLPAFVGRGVGASGVESPGAFVVHGVGAASSAVSSSASRGGATRKTSTPAPPRRSPSSFLSSSNFSSGGGRGGEKTKNSTNRERGSISKAMHRMAESIETGGGGGASGCNMMISMLSMQMQQQTQQFSMQQQMFQQQMQMQMAAMEKRAETSEKYLRRIAKTIGHNKRKRGGDDDEDDSTEDDE
jgi:hypothetical protein